MSFDLQRLQEIDPPAGFCQSCQATYLRSDREEMERATKAYLEGIRTDFESAYGKSIPKAFSEITKEEKVNKAIDLLSEVVMSNNAEAYRCPVCERKFSINFTYFVEERSTEATVYSKKEQYEKAMNDYFTVDGVGMIHLFDEHYNLSHLMKVGWLAKRFKTTKDVNYLIQAISEAEYFIHFATYSFDLFFYGIFTIASQDIPVKGIIGKELKDWKEDLIQEGPDANGRLKHSRGREIYFDRADKFNKVHQKVLIIDGLIAFSGSMNLTSNGVKNLKQGKESFEVESVIEKVKEKDHRLFASHFGKISSDYLHSLREDD